MATIGLVIRRTSRFSLIIAAFASGIGGMVAMVGNGWKEFSSKDRLTFLACSAYEHQLYIGFLNVKRPARLTDFGDTESADGSWFFFWRYPNEAWASKNLGPRVDFGSIRRGYGPLPVFEFRIGRAIDGKFAGIFFRCGDFLSSLSFADEPVYHPDSWTPDYRLNGITSIQANIPSWVLFSLCAVGFIPTALHVYRRLRTQRRRKHGCCPGCNYDLRATPGRCPECGTITEAQ